MNNKKKVLKKSHNSVAKNLILMLATKRSNKKHLTYEEMIDTIIGPIGTNKRKLFDSNLKRTQEELVAAAAEDQLAVRKAKRSEEKAHKKVVKSKRAKYKKYAHTNRSKIREEQEKLEEHVQAGV